MSAIVKVTPLGFPFPCIDPFLFAVYHDDNYPAGEESMGPPESELRGRRLGSDFGSSTGWNMYHGTSGVPGFPKHPHRGFETVTLVRHGVVDHCDSTGASGRFGAGGDAQWMTAGRGISHSEMLPLLSKTGPNRLELFQIWLNLPRVNKMVDPHFKMLWGEQIPTQVVSGGATGAHTKVAVIAGRGFLPAELEATMPLPPPKSYAFEVEQTDVAIVTLLMSEGAKYTLPPARRGALTKRKLFFYKGAEVTVGGRKLHSHSDIELNADSYVELVAGAGGVELLMLQGVPIAEPVVQHGPFVMTSRDEIMQAFKDYQKDEFGAWPHASISPVHPREKKRFAKHGDGKSEERAWPPGTPQSEL